MTNGRTNIDTTRTIIRRQEQQNQQTEQQKNPEGDYYYNNYPARACARAREATAETELPPAEIMQQIAESYRENIGPMITKVAAGIIEKALRNGMEPATVILAIEETGMASRPSPYYLSAVLRNWAQNGVVVCRPRFDELGVMSTKARPWWR